MQRQFPYLVIIQPVVLQGGDVIALRFLLAVQREGQAVDVCLADNEALAGFVIRQDGKVEGLFGTGDEGLLDVEVAENSYSSSNTGIPVFRYAEIMMMKAECLLRTGKSGAGTLVTQVRQRAFKDNPELATVTDSQLAGNTCYQYGYVEDYKIVDRGNTDPIQFGRMYDELGWEFAWEMHRRRDAIRFGIYTTKSWLSHKPEGDYRSVFPIPETVLTSNPNLEQNPNYL